MSRLGNPNPGSTSRIVKIASAISLILACTYYAISVWDRATGGGNHQNPSTNNQVLFPISDEFITSQPWTKINWVGSENPKVRLAISSSASGLSIIVKGVANGSIRIRPERIDQSGNQLVGPAFCSEHGGVICDQATIYRRGDNTLLLTVIPNDPQLSPIKVVLKSGDVPKGK